MSEPHSFPVIAIDGGAAVGKSSTARGLAEQLDLMHADTGSHYRAITLAFNDFRVDLDDEDDVASQLRKLDIGYQLSGRSAAISIDGNQPLDKKLRSEAVNTSVSKVAALPAVRARLLDFQRSLRAGANEHGFKGLVMEGRDIGSVVFPDASFKFFLVADASVRSERRARDGVIDSIDERDRIDSTRKTAPLVRPEGATTIDTTRQTLEEVIRSIRTHIESANVS